MFYLRDQEGLFNKARDLHRTLAPLTGFAQNEQEFTEEQLLECKEAVKSHIDAVKAWWVEVAHSLSTEPDTSRKKARTVPKKKEDPDDLPF